MHKVLVVEDSETLLMFEADTIRDTLHLDVICAASYAQAKEVIEQRRDEIFVALLDLVLPDAPNGEVIDLAIEHKIPSIVFTGQYDEKIRSFFIKKNIVDYILKGSPYNFAHALKLIKRIHKNKNIKALVVDDSSFMRQKMVHSLQRLQIQTLEAKNAAEALDVLASDSAIKIVITEQIMAQMKGTELIEEIRRRHGNDELCIFGVSSYADSRICIEFLKRGANDFLYYPFIEEEFTLRVLNNLDMLDMLRETRENSIRDFLTKLYNRRYLLETGTKLFQNAQRKNITLAVAMVDVDFFKVINDKYGHAIGDTVLVEIAQRFNEIFRSTDIVARFGGEEFCIVLSNPDSKESVIALMERARKKIEAIKINIESKEEKKQIGITVSIGICCQLQESFEAMIQKADENLYIAKERGRNRVVG